LNPRAASGLLLLCLVVASAGEGGRESCRITEVYDGDTVVVQCGWATEERVRLHCIDAPELGQKPWGERARDELAELLGGEFQSRQHGGKAYLQPRRALSVQMERIDTDNYGRTVAMLWRNGINLNLKLVQRGAVAVYSKYCQAAAFYDAEKAAKAARLGIWKGKGGQQRPWIWRHR